MKGHMTMEGTTAVDIQNALHELFRMSRIDADTSVILGEPFQSLLQSADTYAEAGVMTRDNGLVLRMKDGTEFQITIVQSR